MTLKVSFNHLRGSGRVEFEINRPITLIVGPNGAGKSTVLNYIREKTPGRHIYLGPHRAIRRQITRQRFMGSNIPTMSEAMSSPNIQGYEGIVNSSQSRDAWELDEASNILKYSLTKMEISRNAYLIKKFEDEGIIQKSNVSDIWQPLRDLTATLIPTLSFDRIETENIDNMRCLFRSSSKGEAVDFDELSSGEKAVIQMLYPVIEPQIREKLSALSGVSDIDAVKKDFIIIDEPELHLHPTLQESLLSYLRLSTEKNSSFVVLASHSPTIINAADQDDIFLLKHRSQLKDDVENQIISIANIPEKLDMIQEAIGSFFPVTASRPVMFIEGSPRVTVKNYSDKQILEYLDSRFLSVTVMARGGKPQCIASLSESRRILSEAPFKIQALALVDRDYEEGDVFPDGAHRLPVCMIENLLLEPRFLIAGYDVMFSHAPLKSETDIRNALDSIITAVREIEISRRFRQKIRMETLGFGSSVQSATEAKLLRETYIESVNALDYDQTWKDVEEAVDLDISNGDALKKFSGKTVISEFYSRHVSDLKLSKPVFIYHAAQAAGKSGAYRSFFDKIFGNLTVLS